MKASIYLFVIMSFGVSCKKKEQTFSPPPPRSVVTYQVPKAESQQQRRFSGKTEAATSVELGFQLAGRIQHIYAEIGRHYRKGELLARLDAELVNAELQTARAQDLQAKQELRRTQELFESGNASKASFDAAIATQKTASAQLKSADLSIEYASLRMPYDGFVSSVPADVNQVVSIGTPVVHIQSETGMDFVVGIPTSLISQVKKDQETSIFLSAMPQKKLVGRVVKISPSAQENTTYPVTLRIQESQQYEELRADMDGEAYFNFSFEKKNLLSVPISAVQALPDETHCIWIVDDPTAQMSTVSKQLIIIGELSGGGKIEVKEGLKEGQVIVSKGISHITEGMTVSLPRK